MTTRDYLDEIEVQLTLATESGRGRRSPGREALALAPALLAVAAVIAVLVLVAGGGKPTPGRHSTSKQHAVTVTHTATTPASTKTAGTSTTAGTTTTASSAPAGPVPAGFQPSSFTAVSETSWWLLGQAPCSSPPCTSIVRTDDGGAHFVGIPAPRTNQVSQVRFANQLDGFAYGPQLWATLDAGRTWTQLPVGGSVTDLSIAGLPSGGSVFYATVSRGNSGSVLIRGVVGQTTFDTLRGAVAPWGLWADGSQVIVGSTAVDYPAVMISNDIGSSWNVQRLPDVVACNFEVQDGVIWAPCATGMMGGLWRSTDNGSHWSGVGGDAAAGRGGAGSQPNSAPFGAASATTAVYGARNLYRTTDGGKTWSQVGPSGASTWLYIGFTDSTHGVAIGQFAEVNRIYYTTDGGASYHLVAVS